MRLYTPDNLLYPITVTKLLHKPGEDIDVNTPLFVYEYTSTVKEFDPDTREDRDVQRTWPSNFESELEGKLVSLNVRVGQTLTRRSDVGEVEEACQHEVQFQGICAVCGKDLTLTDHYNTTVRDVSRATVNTVHGRTELLISEAVASKADEETKKRLLESRRLSLVVDLDQTIIHATVDPTVAEWQKDESNPNHHAVKNVRAFQLADDFPGLRNTWYYIKLRPGLIPFLEAMSKWYELHIYTMGTRAYAENIAKIIDPDRHIFGDRVLSRDESGSQSAKKLSRLFPVDTKMVVIIDDRADVWQWIPNLVKVPVYDFFVGIGDINGSFLPKRHVLETVRPTKPAELVDDPSSASSEENSATAASDTSDAASASPSSPPSSTNGDRSVVDQLVSIAGNQDADSLKEKAEEQDQTIVAQLEDRPLLQKQKILEAAEEEEAKASPAVEATVALLSENGDNSASSPEAVHPRYRHNLLQDDDIELNFLGQHLRNIHATYFAELDAERTGPNGKIASSSGTSNGGATSTPLPVSLNTIPDVAVIMHNLKSRVLSGVYLVFTGVIPLGYELATSDTVCWAETFGAKISEHLTRRTTHVIASPERRTAKVRQAAKRNHSRGKRGRVHIVSQQWLLACFSRWEHVSEEPYRIHDDAAPPGRNGGAVDGDGGLPAGMDKVGGRPDMQLSDSESDALRDDTGDDDDIESDDAYTITTIARAPHGLGSRNMARLPTRLHTLDTDTDTEAELEQYAPSFERKDSSPTETEHPDEWGEIDEEWREFMGSDAEDDDVEDDGREEEDADNSETESKASTSGPPGRRTPLGQRKRKRDVSVDAEPGSRLQKRKREAAARTSSLTKMVLGGDSLDDEDDDDVDGTGDQGDGDADGDDGWDIDLEAALEAEMQRQGEEEDEVTTATTIAAEAAAEARRDGGAG